MSIIEDLRNDINRAIYLFKQDKGLSLDRQQDVETIRNFLSNTDPMQVRDDLVSFVDNLSNWFSFIFLPLLEVNQFKKVLKSVLEQPKYEEKQFQRAVIAEIRSESILPRFEKLERSFHDQLGSLQKQLASLKKEVATLRNENKFLSEQVSKLSDENKNLRNINRDMTRKYDDLKSEHAALMKENRALRKQLQELTHSNSPKQEATKANIAPKSPYSFISTGSKQNLPSTTPNKSSAQPNDHKLLSGRTYTKV